MVHQKELHSKFKLKCYTLYVKFEYFFIMTIERDVHNFIDERVVRGRIYFEMQINLLIVKQT